MMRILFILLFFICTSLRAEIIDGPANIRFSVQGEKFASIFDGIKVTATELKGNWYRVGIAIRLTEEQYNQSTIVITAKTKLYNRSGELVGETLIDWNLDGKMMGGPKNNRWYATELVGYTYKGNIKPTSIIEREFESLYKQSNYQLTNNQVGEFVSQFNMKVSSRQIDEGREIEQFYVEENWIEDPSPMDRFRILIQDKSLLAIVHSRTLNLPNTKTYELVRGRKITIISKELSKSAIEKFIQSNIGYYNGVD